MAKRKPTSKAPLPEEVQIPKEGYEKVEDFVMKYWKSMVGFLAVILLVIGGIALYKNYYLAPRELAAAEAIAPAQKYWAMDSVSQAVYGDNINPGFQKIATQYGMTKAGKTAAAYAGFCYLKLGEYDNAIKYFKKYKSSDDLLDAQVNGGMGHALAEKGDEKAAAGWYRKAAEASSNDITTPYYYQIAGEMALKTGDAASAKRYFQIIKSDYPQSDQGRAVDKFLGMAAAK